MDETGWRENGRRAWLWAVVGSVATLFAVRASRSRKVVKELLGETFAGIVGSDRYSADSDLPDERHQFCWAPSGGLFCSCSVSSTHPDQDEDSEQSGRAGRICCATFRRSSTVAVRRPASARGSNRPARN